MDLISALLTVFFISNIRTENTEKTDTQNFERPGTPIPSEKDVETVDEYRNTFGYNKYTSLLDDDVAGKCKDKLKELYPESTNTNEE